MWIQIIKRANAAQHISAYDNDVMKMTVIAYEDICPAEELPTAYLWRSYVFSMRHARSRLWSATDLWLGWEAFRQTEEYRQLSGRKRTTS